MGIGTTTPVEKIHVSNGKLFLGSDGQSTTGKFNSQGLTLTSSPISLLFNGEASERPEISFYRGARTYPEFAIREHANADRGAEFYSGSGTSAPVMTMALYIGKVGIGTSTPSEKLSVNGNIRAKEIKVEVTGWPDFVFGASYKLPDLKETERFIKVNRHLPEIPSAKEAEEHGVNLGEMNVKLLQKIEELTLYLIEQNKKQKALIVEVNQLKSEIQQLKLNP